MEEVVRAGGTPFIAYKTNATGAAGGMFERMFHYFLYRRENSSYSISVPTWKSTFSMIKAKFRDHVCAKTDAAMVNEVPLQVPLPQHLLRDSGAVRTGH